MIRKSLATLAAFVIALALVLAALLHWPLPEMPRPGVTGDFLVRNVAIVDVLAMWGCTSLPDTFVACGDDIERWRAGLRDHSHLAPRYIQRSSFAINGEQGVPADAPAFYRARNADEARALVTHHAGSGVDLLKTYTNLSVAAYDALAAEATRRELLFAGHLPVRTAREGTRRRPTQHRASDPLTEIRNTAKIAGVFFNGQYLDRAALGELLAFSEHQAGSVRTNLHLLWGALRSPVIRAQFAD